MHKLEEYKELHVSSSAPANHLLLLLHMMTLKEALDVISFHLYFILYSLTPTLSTFNVI